LMQAGTLCELLLTQTIQLQHKDSQRGQKHEMIVMVLLLLVIQEAALRGADTRMIHNIPIQIDME